jgi:hypothetical protein
VASRGWDFKLAEEANRINLLPTLTNLVEAPLNPTTEVHAEARKRGEIQIPVKKGFSISNLRVSAPPRDDFL